MKKVVEILDKYCQDNNTTEIQIGEFSGGNDSGSFSFNSELSEIDNELYELCEDTLDYGSWAGNFDSSGTISYNSETKIITINGEEIYYENKNFVETITIPVNFEKFNFDSLSFYVNSNDNNTDVNISFNISSGFITKEMADYLDTLTNQIENIFLDYLQEIYKDNVILKKDLINDPELRLNIYENNTFDIDNEIDLSECSE